MRKRIEVEAVWDADLRALLANIGLLDDLLLGNVKCVACGRPVDLDNLGAILPKVDSADVVCDCTKCVRSVTVQASAAAVG
jgi:hypothetical protein